MPDDTDTDAAPAATTTATATQAPPAEGQPDNRDPSPDRQADLRAAYEANVAAGKPPYQDAKIRTLGEVQWILHERDWSADVFHTDGKQSPDLRGAVLTGADLRGVDLFFGTLSGACLLDANLSGADLSRTDLSGAVFTGADLSGAYMIGAKLRGANLIGANLSGARLDAFSSGLHILRADLSGANLSRARLDAQTRLGGATLNEKTRVYGVAWGGARLDETIWPKRLGDELDIKGEADLYRDAARAYRGLSIALRSQGLLIPASNYRLREQVLERKAKLLSFSLLGWVFSWLLYLVAGYGERPARSFVAYLLVLFGFAGAYYTLGTGLLGFGTHDAISSPLAALVFSVTSFHGRGFFPGGLALDDPITVVAAAEAIIGLFIEITFIATFTQRFFGSR